jgi:hypothetical protein
VNSSSTPILVLAPKEVTDTEGNEDDGLTFVCLRANRRSTSPFDVTEEWRKNVFLSFDSRGIYDKDNLDTIEQDLQEKANQLASVLDSHLHSQIKRRVKKVKKQVHWVWDFTFDNLTRVAAIIICMGHVKDDIPLQAKLVGRCLLKKSSAFVPICIDIMKKELTSEVRNKGAISIFTSPKGFGFAAEKLLVVLSGPVIWNTGRVRYYFLLRLVESQTFTLPMSRKL